MTSLVDRYVYTTLRRIPEQQRADIDRELRASIDDAVDARVEAGQPPEEAVESTLLELGDPARLADRYAERPNYLIGPDIYPVWRGLVRTLFAIVLPLTVAIVVIFQLLDDPSPGKVIGAAIGAVFQLGIQLTFWPTLLFVIIERTGAWRGTPWGLRMSWSLNDLPRYEPGSMTTGQLLTYLSWPAMLIAALVLQQFTFTDQPVLDPANWSFWWPFLVAVLVLRGAWAVIVNRKGAWTRTAAVLNAVLSLLFGAPLIVLLATHHFTNPAFHLLADNQRAVAVIGIVTVAFVTVWDIVEVTRRAERARRGLPIPVPGTGGSYNFG